MLAQRISSINSLSALCEKTGADINEISTAIGMDHRIGPHFLRASVAFGGSCFQKDILNLAYLCQFYGLDEVAEYWHQVVKINDYQKNRFVQKIIDFFDGNIKSKNITIVGWSFKKGTKDTRESPSIHVASRLLILGAQIIVIDPLVDKERINLDINEWLAKNGLSTFKSKELLRKIKLSQSFDNNNSDLISIIHDINTVESKKLKSNNIPIIKI